MITIFTARLPSLEVLQRRMCYPRSLTNYDKRTEIVCRYITGLEDRLERMEALLKRVRNSHVY
jgi:hypothetical protein